MNDWSKIDQMLRPTRHYKQTRNSPYISVSKEAYDALVRVAEEKHASIRSMASAIILVACENGAAAKNDET